MSQEKVLKELKVLHREIDGLLEKVDTLYQTSKKLPGTLSKYPLQLNSIRDWVSYVSMSLKQDITEKEE